MGFPSRALVAALGFFAAASAGADSPRPVPDVRGVWQATYASAADSGKVVRQLRLEIERQEGELLWGWDTWHPVDQATGRVSDEWRRDALAGSLDRERTGGTLAGAGKRVSFRLLGPDRMEIAFTSLLTIAGFPPVTFFAEAHRSGSGPLAEARWPRLEGVWQGRCVKAWPDGAGARPCDVRLDVVRQDGQVLWVENVWTVENGLQRDPMRGALDLSGRAGLISKERARFAFRLLGDDRMEVEFVRVGGAVEPAAAFYAVLERGGVAPAPAPPSGVSMLGTWVGDYRYVSGEHGTSSSFRIEIKRQDGACLWADDVWVAADPVSGKPTGPAHRDPMLGSLAPDGRRGVLAKPDADLSFSVLDPDHIAVELVRVGGDAERTMAFNAVMTRQR